MLETAPSGEVHAWLCQHSHKHRNSPHFEDLQDFIVVLAFAPICNSYSICVLVVKQPYVHNYHTEVVHHHVVQNEFIPNYTCSEVHVNEPDNFNVPR